MFRLRRVLELVLASIALAGCQPGLQARADATCGPKALHRLLLLNSINVDFGELVNQLGAHRPSHSMLELKEASAKFGLRLQGVRTNLSRIEGKNRPAILLLDAKHYIVFESMKSNLLTIWDGDQQPNELQVRDSWLLNRWSGYALIQTS
jgi:ABC-type bacteriocin/lantibiotic exporter with double-glycine peptidase domain